MHKERILTYTVADMEAGLKLGTFLRHRGLSRQNLVMLKKLPDTVLVDGISRHFDYRVSAGNLITLRIVETGKPEGILPVALPLDILYEDEDLIVLNKPAGMPVHPSKGNRDNTLANALAWYYAGQGIPFVFRCSNRLDRDTSGVILVARHYLSASMLSEMGVRREIGREYLGIIRGEADPPEGTITLPIGRLPGSILQRVVDPDNGEYARTFYRTVYRSNGHTLLRLKLDTGRTHQIRIHLKAMGFPLIGDYLYNPDMEWISRQALHAWKLSFIHPILGRPMSFRAPLPPDMRRVLSGKTDQPG